VMGWLTVKNWERFQHYKDRKPPWIKLYRDILDDKVYLSLPVASMALAPCIWLIASENDGKISDNPADLAWRVRRPDGFCTVALQALVGAGFLSGSVDTANKTLATRGQLPIPEREGETEREKEKEGKPGRFAPPTLEEIAARIKEKNYHYSAEAFHAYYASIGWKVGNKPMKDWKQAMVTWEEREKAKSLPQATGGKKEILCRDCKQPLTKIETMEGSTCRTCRSDHGV
jgi:hypothetical protein